MLIKQAQVLVGKSFVRADIAFGETITAIGTLPDPAELDGTGCYVVPGFVDIHTHGAMGCDFSDGRRQDMQTLADYYASCGVTSYLATTMAMGEDELLRAMDAVGGFCRQGGAKCAGVHLEGPFLSAGKRGAQAARNIRLPDRALFDRLNAACGGQVRMITLACECPGAMEFIRYASEQAVVSLGHTECTYEQAMEAFSCGASHVTHMFNAMAGFHHRQPGLMAAAMDAGASVELICDGLHVHPAAVRIAHRLYGDRLDLISDSMRCAGLSDGEYTLGGQAVTVRDGRACLSGTDTLAGSSISLLDGVRNAVAFDIPLADALYAASTAPARAAGLDDVGELRPGLRADVLVLDRDLALKTVFVDGVRQI